MMSASAVARLAALVAILGFFLPWAEVSCAGQPMAHESGVQLLTGTGAAAPLHPDLWVAASFGLAILGLAASFIMRGRRGAMALTAAALAAAIVSLIGVSQEVPSADVQAQLTGGAAGGDASAPQAAGQFIRAKLEFGYLVTLGGLIVAIAAGAAGMSGRPSAGARTE